MSEENSFAERSVAEIVQMLHANSKKKYSIDIEDIEEQPSKASQIFPWFKKFTLECREVIADPDIIKLDELITTFLKHVEESVKQCYKKPKRAFKLKTRMYSFLQVFNTIYRELQEPLEHTNYLDKMSDVMALYIDIELKSSWRGKEHPKKISERICSSLFVFLDKSIEHMLNTVLKAKFFVKKYSDICCPIIARLLKEKPGPVYETTYVRYLLSFKLWKKLAGKDHYVSINKEAVAKLKPPPGFMEKLKSGMFSNVLPHVIRSEKERLTLFFMQSPFNVKDKAQVFLKDEKKMQPNLDVEKSLMFDDDFQITGSFFDEETDELNHPNLLLNEIWKNLIAQEDDSFDIMYLPMDIIDAKEDEEDIFVELKKSKTKEKTKKIVKNKATNGVVKNSMKKRKGLKINSNNVKNIPKQELLIDLIRTDLTKPVNSAIPKEEKEDPLSSLTNSPEQKQKPCAAIEPEQCKEVTESFNNVTPIKLVQNHSTNSPDPVGREAVVSMSKSKEEEQSISVETSAPSIVTNPELGVINPTTTLETPTTTVDSSGICEEVKSETLSKEFFEDQIDSAFKVGKLEDYRILEGNIVAQEVVIGSEMEQDGTFKFYLLDGKIDQNIMNVIELSRDPTEFCYDEVVVDTELSPKDLENQQTAIGSLLDNQNISFNNSKDHVEEDSSTPPDLSPIMAQTEANESDELLIPRQDSRIRNDMFLRSFLSDPTLADDGSDDDSRHQNSRRFAYGEKRRPTCREHIEPKPGNEGFESLTPSSESMQQSPMGTSSDMTSLQPATLEFSPSGSDHEIKALQNLTGDEISPHSNEGSEKKSAHQDLPQMKLSPVVHLSRGDLRSANEHIFSTEKISPKGMFAPPPDNILHFKTVDFDTKFEQFQIQLFSLYNNINNILETDPVPYPPDRVTGIPINGYVRCPCTYCDNNFVMLDKNYHSLFQMRSTKILYHVDKKRLLTKILDKKKEDDKLLKTIEDTIAPASIEVPNPTVEVPNPSIELPNPEKETESRINSGNEARSRIEITDPEPKKADSPIAEAGNKPENCDNSDHSDSKNMYERLPPKKRKAFNVELDSNHNFNESCNSLKVQHSSRNKKPKEDNEQNTVKALTSHSQVQNRPNENPDPVCEEGSNFMSKESSTRFSPVKIKAVHGSYFVLGDGESSSTTEVSVGDSNVSNENIPEIKKRCGRKRHKRSKEEKRLRKEQKRLKKLEKQKKLEEERSHN